jgi:hypothetical protein
MPVGVRSPTVGFITSWWVPMATIAAFPTITAANVTSGTNLTKFELSDSKVQLNNSDTINEKAIGDLANTDVPTFAKYDGCQLHLFRSYAPAWTSLVGTDDPLAVFTGRPFGYYIRRAAKVNTGAATTGDVVEAYLFQADSVQIEANDGGNMKIMVPLLQQGVYNLAITLT